MQEVRQNLPNFLERIANGATITVIYHSKPLVTLTSSQPNTVISGPKGTQHFLDVANKAHKTAKGALNPNKSIKQLYTETMNQKYGVR